MITAPCKDCADRHPNCHSECERYGEYKKERTEMLKERMVDHDYRTAHSLQISKVNWRKVKKRLRR